MVVETVGVDAVMKMKITVIKKLVGPVLTALKKIGEAKKVAKIMRTIS
jgi:hypothetical protein